MSITIICVAADRAKCRMVTSGLAPERSAARRHKQTEDRVGPDRLLFVVASESGAADRKRKSGGSGGDVARLLEPAHRDPFATAAAVSHCGLLLLPGGGREIPGVM